MLHDGCTMGDLIVLAATRYPDRVAMRDDRGEFTYEQLAERVRLCAYALRSNGVGRGDGVAQLASNTIDAWVVQAACYVLGAYFVGLHARASDDDIVFILRDSTAKVLVIDEEAHPGRREMLQAHVETLETSLTHSDRNDTASLWSAASQAPSGRLVSMSRVEDLARLAYTGGTTGRPKGVMLPHRSLTYNTLQIMADNAWPHEIRCLLCAPITHGSGAFVLPTLLRGGTVTLVEHFTPDVFIDVVVAQQITATILVPSMIYALLDHPRSRAADLHSLQLILYGASPIAPTRLAEALELFGPILQQTYGQTEAPNTIATLLPADHRPGRLTSIGTPYTGIQVALADDNGQPVAIGERGEICVRGPLVMDGYWRRPEETADAIRDGWLRTGDVAYADDEGFLYLSDRKKEMIVSGGFNVFPKEVEDALLSHPSVAVAAVIGVPDERWGEAVKAVVVPRAGQIADPIELTEFVRMRKGPIQAPKSVDVVSDIPLTAVGKPDKVAIRARFWRGRQRNVS